MSLKIVVIAAALTAVSCGVIPSNNAGQPLKAAQKARHNSGRQYGGGWCPPGASVGGAPMGGGMGLGMSPGYQDMDNDGIPDSMDYLAYLSQIGAGRDSDMDGRPDAMDGDSNGNGILDILEVIYYQTNDFDQDGVPNAADVDQNNDGNPDYKNY